MDSRVEYSNAIRMGVWVAATLLDLSGCVHVPQQDEMPLCAFPAPLGGVFDPRAPGFFIGLKPTAADGVSVSNDLARRYGFEVERVLSATPTLISGPMSAQTVAQLRCDPAVEAISHDAVLKNVTL